MFLQALQYLSAIVETAFQYPTRLKNLQETHENLKKDYQIVLSEAEYFAKECLSLDAQNSVLIAENSELKARLGETAE